MQTLIYKRKKDKPPFIDRWDSQHKGYVGSISNETQRKAMSLVGDRLQSLSKELKEMGYDPSTMKFSIKEQV